MVNESRAQIQFEWDSTELDNHSPPAIELDSTTDTIKVRVGRKHRVLPSQNSYMYGELTLGTSLASHFEQTRLNLAIYRDEILVSQVGSDIHKTNSGPTYGGEISRVYGRWWWSRLSCSNGDCYQVRFYPNDSTINLIENEKIKLTFKATNSNSGSAMAEASVVFERNNISAGWYQPERGTGNFVQNMSDTANNKHWHNGRVWSQFSLSEITMESTERVAGSNSAGTGTWVPVPSNPNRWEIRNGHQYGHWRIDKQETCDVPSVVCFHVVFIMNSKYREFNGVVTATLSIKPIVGPNSIREVENLTMMITAKRDKPQVLVEVDDLVFENRRYEIAESPGAKVKFRVVVTEKRQNITDVQVKFTQTGSFFNQSLLGTKTINIPANSNYSHYELPIINDSSEEMDGTITAEILDRPTLYLNAFGGRWKQRVVNVLDDDPTLTIADANGDEGNANINGVIEFMPTLSLASSQDIVITYSTTSSEDFPVDANDYTPVTNATITIPAGRTTPVTPIQIITSADSVVELDEKFTLTYRADHALVIDNTAIGTINNDDGQVLSVSSATVDEDAGTADLTISLSPAPRTGETVSVKYSTSNGTAVGSSNGTSADFTSIPTTTVVFLAGETSKSVSINITNDNTYERTEIFYLTVSTSTNNVSTHAGGIGTVIINDNLLPTVSLIDLSGNISEGTSENNNTTQNIMVSLGSNKANQDISVYYTLTGITENAANVPLDIKLASNAPSRYSDSTGTLTIAQGTSSAIIPLEIIADKYDENDEIFKITLINASGATIGTESITATISDDDAEPSVDLEYNTYVYEKDVDVTETITFILNNASGKTVTVPYTVSFSSAATNDITLRDGTVTFSPNSTDTITPTEKTVSYTINADSMEEYKERFRIRIGTITNGSVSSSISHSETHGHGQTIYLLDNHDAPTMSIADASGAEGTQIEFMPTLTRVASRDIQVWYSTNYHTAGDFPASFSDFTRIISSATYRTTIPAGQLTPISPIRVNTTADNLAEPDETFTFSLDRWRSDVAITDYTAIGTIENNDGQIVAISSTTVNEDAGTAELKNCTFTNT